MKVKTLIDKRGDHEECILCGSKEDLTVDHIVPVVKGGGDGIDWTNLQILCRRCNTLKGKMDMAELQNWISIVATFSHNIAKKNGKKPFGFCPYCGEKL